MPETNAETIERLRIENAQLRAENARWCARIKELEHRINEAVNVLHPTGNKNA